MEIVDSPINSMVDLSIVFGMFTRGYIPHITGLVPSGMHSIARLSGLLLLLVGLRSRIPFILGNLQDTIVFYNPYGGFHKSGYTNSWMVYNGKCYENG